MFSMEVGYSLCSVLAAVQSRFEPRLESSGAEPGQAFGSQDDSNRKPEVGTRLSSVPPRRRGKVPIAESDRFGPTLLGTGVGF